MRWPLAKCQASATSGSVIWTLTEVLNTASVSASPIPSDTLMESSYASLVAFQNWTVHRSESCARPISPSTEKTSMISVPL